MESNSNYNEREIHNIDLTDSCKEENDNKKYSENEGDIISEDQMNYMNDINSFYRKYNKKYFQFINAIFHDDKIQIEKILNSCQSTSMVNYSCEGFTPIQYAALYGCISCFEYLLSLKVNTDKRVEGLNLIHLSLSRAIFKKEQEKCLKMFHYIYNVLPEQRYYVDRLGRTFLHIIFEYDFIDALDKININLEDLFQEDNNGEYVINYVYIYNSNQCFWKVAKDPQFLAEIYKEIRRKYENNKGAKYLLKEKFLDNLFIHQNYYIIGIMVINCSLFINELIEDLNNLKKYYSQIDQNESEIEQNCISQIKENISYTLNMIENFKNKKLFDEKFNFPNKIREFTAIVFNPNCINHIKLPDEPIKHLITRFQMLENSDRLQCLIDKENGIILNDQVFHFQAVNLDKEFKNRMNLEYSGSESILFYETERKSTLNDILKCHDFNYIKRLKEFFYLKNHNQNNNKKKEDSPKKEKGIQFNLNSINGENLLYRNLSNNSLLLNYQKLDCDTYINEYSYENIYYSTGCVLEAVDLVMKGKVKNALALIRPPGHNAGFYGPVENLEVNSSGFCIVNNVAIGAAYAKNIYRNIIKKIAIFDFDIHHGNGTEEIIQMLNDKTFIKSFNYDKICSFTTKNTKQINWLDLDDPKNILFISTHIYDEQNQNGFFPYSGGYKENTSKNSNIYPGGIFNIPFNIRKNLSYEYRNILRTKIIPRLYKFKPDIIFISSGFDGHKNEIINKQNMFLNEFDFAYITQEIQFVANKFCEGRVISVLEGGYNVSTGLISSFAQSVFTHARFLNLSLNMFQCFNVKLTGLKRKYEMDDEIDTYNKINKSKNKFKKCENFRLNEEDFKKEE